MTYRWQHAGLLCLLLLSLSACGRPTVNAPAPGQQENTEYTASGVVDTARFPQDLEYFSTQAGANRTLMTPARLAAANERFHTLFFSAWSADKPSKGHLAFFRGELARTGSKRGYAENLQPWSAQRWKQMELNADLGHFPTMRQAAITVCPTNLRLAPTSRPRFGNPATPGQGYPFDEFQQSAVPAGFPLMVFHRSKDGAWFYAESSYVSGWVSAEDVAFIDDAMQRTWRNSSRVVFVQDDVPLISSFGAFLCYANIGTVLPVKEDGKGNELTVLAPARTDRGWAVPAEVRVSRADAAPMPLPFTPGQMSVIGNRLMGQPYGWAGLYGDRDCSAMMHDLFSTFGIWLPRNSASQAKAGTFINLEKLSSGAKEDLIRKDGVPFLTLLWLPGHIGLYVGEYKGDPAFFHNIWGLRTRNDGRFVLGRAVVTSIKAGQELPNIDPEALLVGRMKGMTILGRE